MAPHTSKARKARRQIKQIFKEIFIELIRKVLIKKVLFKNGSENLSKILAIKKLNFFF